LQPAQVGPRAGRWQLRLDLDRAALPVDDMQQTDRVEHLEHVAVLREQQLAIVAPQQAHEHPGAVAQGDGGPGVGGGGHDS
jgi:hypothetical protein